MMRKGRNNKSARQTDGGWRAMLQMHLPEEGGRALFGGVKKLLI